MTPRLWLLPVASVLACADPLSIPEGDPAQPPASDAPLQPGLPTFSGACDLDDPAATTLLVTTTDFTTGAVTVVEPDGTVRPDLALGSTDAVPYPSPYGPLVVHRFTHDFVDVLDPSTWRSRSQHALTATDATSPNPHAIAFDAHGIGYLTLFGSAFLQRIDLQQAPGASGAGTIDLTPFADADGIPEASVAVRCGDTLWVGVQRLARMHGWDPVGQDQLVAVDLTTGVPWDFDPDLEGGQGLRLGGSGLGQLRRVPGDDAALYGLTAGIERIDLRQLQTAWALSPETLAEHGVHHSLQLMAFDVSDDGARAWIAAFLPADDDVSDCIDDPLDCFGHAQLFEADLDADTLQPFGTPFEAKDRTVQHVADVLWVGSSAIDSPGLYRYDLGTTPPTLLDGPHDTGLPPYSIAAVRP